MLTTVFVFGLCLLGSLSTAHAAPAAEGFRGIPWGAAMADWQHELVLVETEGETHYYTRTGDKLAIGETPLLLLLYGFYQGKFAVVYGTCAGYTHFQQLKEAFTQTFGPPTRPNQFLDTYFWGLQSPVLRYLTYKSGQGEGRFLLQDMALNAQKERDALRKAKAAGKDF